MIKQSNAEPSSIVSRMVDLSTESYYNPYKDFIWPDKIPDNKYWFSPELISVYNTQYADLLNENELIQLSKWESINFCSVNVNGIREQLLVILDSLYKNELNVYSEYFHHFIGEENEHMWFFAQFCLRYGGKIYKDKRLKLSSFESLDIKYFLNFAKILIFEEIGDYYNVHMKNDDRLHPIVRQINKVHHQDELRHLVIGREIVKSLHKDLQKNCSVQKIREIEVYLKKYILLSIESLYNPLAYKDAGIEQPYELRRKLLKQPFRKIQHKKVLNRIDTFFKRNNIFIEEAEWI